MPDLIPENFDDFMAPEPDKSPDETAEGKTLEGRFSEERLSWSAKIKEMAKAFSDIVKTGELMTEVYTERQRALEYYHYIISLLVKLNKKYNKSYSEKWKFYTYDGNERFPNETQKVARILADLADLKEKREALDNHAKFMEGTVKTIDNLIFGIKYKIEITQIGRGK
jgi:hypothetical protein